MKLGVKEQPDELSLFQALVNHSKAANELTNDVIKELAVPLQINSINNVEVEVRQRIAKLCFDNKQQIQDYIKLPKFKKIKPTAQMTLERIVDQVWSTFLQLSNNQHQRAQFHRNQQKHYLDTLESFHLRNFHLLMSQHQTQIYGLPFNFSQHMFHSQFSEKSYPIYSEQPNIEAQKANITPKIQQPLRQNSVIEKKSPSFRKTKQLTSPFPGSSKSFVGCHCKGKISLDQPHYECLICHKKFHFKCMRLPQKSEGKVGKMCPLCKLKDPQINIFYEIVGDPLESQYLMEKQTTKKLTIKGKKCREIYENDLSLHIRMMELKVRKKEEIPEEPIDEIIIDNEALFKDNWEDVKLSIQLPTLEEEPHSEIIFMAVLILRKRSQEEIITQIKHKQPTNEEYLNQFISEGKQLKIYVLNKNEELMTLAGRGIHCHHIEVVDIEQLVKEGLENEDRVRCYICGRVCNSFTVDDVVNDKIVEARPVSEFDGYIEYQNRVLYWKEQYE